MSATVAPAGSASTAVLLAADRLSVSRRHLQQAMMPPPHTSTTSGTSNRTLFAGWLDRLISTPSASILADTVQRWWARHPMRLPLLLAGDAVQTLIQPLAQKHPYRLVLGTAAAGGLLVLSQPWRWLPRAALASTLMAGLLPTLISQAVSPLSSNAWMRLLATLTQTQGVPPDQH